MIRLVSLSTARLAAWLTAFALVMSVMMLASPTAARAEDTAPRGSISGKITRESDGTPVDGTEVRLYKQDAGGTWQSDYRSEGVWPDGTYSFTNLGSGVYTMRFLPNQALELRTEWWHGVRTLAEAATIEVQPGQVLTGMNIALSGGESVSGTLTSSA